MFKRFCELFKHYGFTPRRFEKALQEFVQLARQYSFVPTFPVTACVVKRNIDVFQKVDSHSVDWAVHGLNHIDYTQLTLQHVNHDYQRAQSIFNGSHLSYHGFRFPFLRRNLSCIQALSENHFCWDSSEAIEWDVIDQTQLTKKQRFAYQKIMESYHPVPESKAVSLPVTQKKLIEIPVSLPDDDLLLSRLNICDHQTIWDIWHQILERVIARGEHFALQVHPERFLHYKVPLERLVREIVNDKNAYVASLTEISNWWIEKNNFRFEIETLSDGQYKIRAKCTKRASILIKNEKSVKSSPGFFEDYSILDGHEWIFSGNPLPVIGLHPEIQPEIVQFLRDEGYFIEISSENKDYAIYFDDKSQLNLDDKVHILHTIESTQNPLVRFWRWPDQKQYAFTVSGDIDAVVIQDYFNRFRGC